MKMMKKLGAAAVSAAAACTSLSATVFAESGAAASDGTAVNTTGAMLIQLVPFAIALVLLYFILLRPQQKREKEAQAMRENVHVGDEVCTAGGIVGIVLKVRSGTKSASRSGRSMRTSRRLRQSSRLTRSARPDAQAAWQGFRQRKPIPRRKRKRTLTTDMQR